MSLPKNLPIGVTAVMLPELDRDAQLTLCQSLGVTHYVARPRLIPDKQRDQPFSNWGHHAFDLTPQRLVDTGPQLQQQLQQAGLQPFATVPNLTTQSPDDDILLACRGALALGAQRVRLTPHPIPPDKLYDWPKHLDQLQARFREALQIADHAHHAFPDAPPIKFTVEIHTGLPTPSPGLALQLLQPFDPQRAAAILDLPNLAREGLTAPAVAISVLSQYLDHCHVGGARRTPHPPDEQGFTGSHTHFTSLKDSDLHLPTWLQLLAQFADQHQRDIPLICEDYSPNLTGQQRLTRTVQELQACF